MRIYNHTSHLSLSHIEHAYNVCLSVPYGLPLSLPSSTAIHLQWEQDKATTFIHPFQKLKEKGNFHSCHAGEKLQQEMTTFMQGTCCMHLDKCRFKGKADGKIKPLGYEPYNVIRQVSVKAFSADHPLGDWWYGQSKFVIMILALRLSYFIQWSNL